LASGDDIIGYLEPFCADASVDAAVRIAVMQIIDDVRFIVTCSLYLLYIVQAIH